MECNNCEKKLSLTDNEFNKMIKTQFGGALTVKTCETCGEEYYVNFPSSITVIVRTLAIALFGLSFLGFRRLFPIEISLVIGVFIIAIGFGVIRYAIHKYKLDFSLVNKENRYDIS